MSKIFNRNVVVRENLEVDGTTTLTGAVADSNGAVVRPQVAANGTVVAKTGNATITAAEFGSIITNTGASGTITLTLPAASTVSGKSIQFKVLAAQIVNVSPAATDGIFLAGSGVDNKDLVIAGTIGNTVTVYSNGDNYEAYYPNGVVTKEA